MASLLLHVGATVQCSHGGKAQPVAPFDRVLVSGMAVVTMTGQYSITGCPFTSPASGPCVTAQWVVAATRVFAGGAPLVLQDSQAICTPTGTPLNVISTQNRVTGL
jgi:hypothetical protein